MDNKTYDVEDAMTVLTMDCYFNVLPSVNTIKNVANQLIPFFHDEYCKKLEIDQTDNLQDRIIIHDIDCPNECDELIYFKGFSFEQLMWLGLQEIYQKYIRFEKREGVA